jgi:hypothetical protein
VVSWASPGPATRPRVRLGQRVIPAEPRPYTDGLNGETVWTYHARVGGLRPGATYAYVVTADNDGNASDPFSATLAGRRDDSVDWIIVQMHQCAASSSVTGNGSDLGIRQQWLPLFDRYEVDLVLNGHDHDYERSFPVRGADPDVGQEVATGAVVNTLRPHPVTTTDSGESGGQTSITVTHYHALGADPVNPATGDKGAPTPDYTEFETFRLVRPR